MKQCIYCKSNIKEDVVICPHCHKKQTNNYLWDLAVMIAVIGAICVLVSVIGALLDDNPKSTYDDVTLANVISIEYSNDMI